MKTITLTGRMYLQVGGLPGAMALYEGMTGDVLEVPDDVAALAVSHGYAEIQTRPQLAASTVAETSEPAVSRPKPRNKR